MRTVKVYRIAPRFKRGEFPKLELVKHKLIDPSIDGDVLLVDGESGESVGCVVHLSSVKHTVSNFFERKIKEKKLARYVLSNDRITSVDGHVTLVKVNANSVIFGVKAPNHLKRLPLPGLSAATSDSEAYEVVSSDLATLATLAARIYKQVATNLFEAQVKAVREGFGFFGGGAWTSSVVNIDSDVPTHRDGRNLASWNAIYCYRVDNSPDTQGGNLCLVDLALDTPEGPMPVLAQRTGDLVLYPAYAAAHGTTRLVRKGRGTLVFYALKL